MMRGLENMLGEVVIDLRNVLWPFLTFISNYIQMDKSHLLYELKQIINLSRCQFFTCKMNELK